MDLKPTVNTDPRRILPSVDRLMREMASVAADLPLWAAQNASKTTLDQVRDQISQGDHTPAGKKEILKRLTDQAVQRARRLIQPHPRSVINATGVVLHTNLGRAPLATAAQIAVTEASRGYSNLELDLETGRRGSRLGQLEAKLIALSGAEAAHVVNNNAAAVLLALNTLALGKEVVVSRGELVEIGGSFRVPAIMERAGVRLREIGTTNRTHLSDYEGAIGSETALLLKVHRSNFEQRGFIAEADVRELAELAQRRGIHAPTRLRLGVDVVCFSGDKLLGGPQAGILLGTRSSIEAMRRNPLARALRIDKLTVAALDATLDLMLDETRAGEIPVVSGLRSSATDLEPRAQRLLEKLGGEIGAGWRARIEASEAAVGGGSLPEHRLPGWAVVLEGPHVGRLARRLREAPTPVLARVRDDSLWLDVRTLADDDLDEVVAAVGFGLH
jgi:L-seryl-tRNA(Ser) seleniumtransferase